MAPFELLLLSALVAGSVSLPSNKLPSYRGEAGQWDASSAREPHSARPWTTQNTASPLGYQCFDGAFASNADTTKWHSFGQLWAVNEPYVLLRNRGDTYITHYIREAIVHVADEDEIDAGLVLAIMMQEVRHAQQHSSYTAILTHFSLVVVHPYHARPRRTVTSTSAD